MTLPDERLRAIQWARTFLLDLMDPSKTKRVPREIRSMARAVLKHYPTPYEIERLSTHSLLGGAVRNGDEQA